MVEALLVVMSLRGEIFGVTHLGEPPGKMFTSMQECTDWLDTEEANKIVVDMGNVVEKIYPVPVRIAPACRKPNEA
jgi:hypothetical protein